MHGIQVIDYVTTTPTINVPVFTVFHGSMFATRGWIVPEDLMRDSATRRRALMLGNLSVGIHQSVWHWKIFVMV